MSSAEQTSPGDVAAEALASSMGYAGAFIKRHERYTQERVLAAAQTMATAAHAAATLELARQQQIRNLIALSAAGGNLGVSPEIQQAALQLAAEALVDLDMVLAGNEAGE